MSDFMFELFDRFIMPGFFWLFGIVVALAILWGLAWIVCEIGAAKWEADGVVVGKSYSPDTQETNAVPVFTGQGGGVGVVTTGHEREWITLIEVDGTVYEFNNVTTYTKTKNKDRVHVGMKRNAVSGTSLRWVQR